MRAALSQHVVAWLATRATHTPRPLLLKHDGAMSEQKYCSLWLWVPAFAGTTAIVGSRHCEERSDEAIHSSFVRRDGLLRCARNDGCIQLRIPAARCARVVLELSAPKKSEGAGKAGCWLAPAVSCAISARKNAHEHTGISRGIRPSLRNGLTAYGALSLETNSSCLHRRRIDGSHRPVELCKPSPA